MNETDNPKARRLNPFAFPSETNVRFTLLVVTALGTAYGIGLYVGQIAGVLKVPEWNSSWIVYLLFFALPSSLVLSVLILAIALYRSYPNRIRRAKNLKTIVEGDDPQFVDMVHVLVRVSGISPSPSIELGRESQSVDGQAFGLRNRYALRLGRGLRLLLRKKPAEFKAIVLHELGHVANQDITRTYFAQAIWVAFVALPMTVVTISVIHNFIAGFVEKLSGGLEREEIIRIITLNIPTTFIFLFQFGVTLAFVASMRASILRVREIYADWRVSLWGGRDALVDILRINRSRDGIPSWTRLWRLHPTSQERLDALENPERLFRVNVGVSFFVGFLLGYLADSLTSIGLSLAQLVLRISGLRLELLETIIPFLSVTTNNNSLVFSIVSMLIDTSFYAMLALILIIMIASGIVLPYLLLGTLGLEVQREAIADMAANKQRFISYLKLWIPAALISIGYQVGILLVPLGLLALLPDLINIRGFTIFAMMLIQTGVMMCLIWLGLVYIRFFAKRMLGIHTGSSPSHRARRLLTFFTSVWLLIFFLPVLLGYYDLLNVANGQTIIFSRWAGALTVVSLGILSQYIIVFAITWLLVQAYRLFRKPHCPSCNQITKKRYAVGQVCEHCGQNLAPWLFVGDPLVQTQHKLE